MWRFSFSLESGYTRITGTNPLVQGITAVPLTFKTGFTIPLFKGLGLRPELGAGVLFSTTTHYRTVIGMLLEQEQVARNRSFLSGLSLDLYYDLPGQVLSLYAGGGLDLLPERAGPIVLPLVRAGLRFRPFALGKRAPARVPVPAPVPVPVPLEEAPLEPPVIETPMVPVVEPPIAEPPAPIAEPPEAPEPLIVEPSLVKAPIIEPPIVEPLIIEPLIVEPLAVKAPAVPQPVPPVPPPVPPVEAPLVAEGPPAEEPEPPEPLRLVYTVYFEPDTSRPLSYEALDAVGTLLVVFPESYVTIHGYAAPFVSPAGQRSVSRERALAARDYLEQRHNIPGSRLITAWHGADTLPEGSAGSHESRRSAQLVLEARRDRGPEPRRFSTLVYFEPDTSRPLSYEALDSAGTLLAAFPESYVTIHGYAAPFASPAGQRSVSRERALAARDYLEQRHNIPGSRLITAWHGADTLPEGSTGSPESRRSAHLIIEHWGDTKERNHEPE